MLRLPLLLLLAGCPEYGYHGKVPDPGVFRAGISVEPDRVKFGLLPDGHTRVETVLVRSVGDVALLLGPVTVSGGAFTIVSEVPEALSPGEELELLIQFEPDAPTDMGQLSIPSSDPDQPLSVVDLSGEGLVPMLTIDPMAIDFGVVQGGPTYFDTIRLANVGTAELSLDNYILTGEGFRIASAEPTPLILSPGAHTEVDVFWDTAVMGTYAADLWIDSSVGPQLAPLDGVAADLPVAVCGVTPEEVLAHQESATWLGFESHSQDGEQIVTYDWTLIRRPPGSQATLGGSGANRSFLPDLAGAYATQLIVGTASGLRSEPCLVGLEAVPGQNLWVELFWSHPGDDMDIHLLAPGGQLNTSSDCFYWNCVGGGLDWGTSSYVEDDPSLDFDDIPGTGPENINIWEPAPGTYEVWVHDFPGHWFEGDNSVTVNVFVYGALAETETRVLSGDDDFHSFFSVEFPSGTVSVR